MHMGDMHARWLWLYGYNNAYAFIIVCYMYPYPLRQKLAGRRHHGKGGAYSTVSVVPCTGTVSKLATWRVLKLERAHE